MENFFQFMITSEEEGVRLDAYLPSKLPGVTRSFTQKILQEGHVSVNGAKKNKNYKLKKNDAIEVIIPGNETLDVLPEDIPLNIVFEDEQLIVLNKPKGIVVHPGAGNWSGTLVNALLYHCKESLSGINGVVRPGIVHRIDKDTSGLLLVAKTNEAHISLAKQLEEHSIKREYHAVVYGTLKIESGVIDKPIGRDEKNRTKMTVTEKNSRHAITHFNVISYLDKFTYLLLHLETGRTHQIRVHMSNIGHPLAGDAVYGPKKVIKELNGQCLHAKKIGFVHPKTNQYMEFDSELPLYFSKFIEKHKGKMND